MEFRETIGFSLFFTSVQKKDTLLARFDKDLWHTTVDRVIVTFGHEITFRFKGGTELPWTI